MLASLRTRPNNDIPIRPAVPFLQEEKKQEQKYEINGVKLVVKEVVARRKLRNSYEYEVSWVGQPIDKNT